MKKSLLIFVLIVALVLSCGCTPQEQSDTTVQTEPDENFLRLSAESGVYAEAFSLSLSASEGARIYYTTDGSDPSGDGSRLYTQSIPITDRSGDANVVSAVDPLLFSGNYCKPNAKKDGFTCSVGAPSDDAVDKCTVVRVYCEFADGSTATKNAVYFIGTAQEHIQGLADSCAASGASLAVISICMDYDDLFDPATGIYVKGNCFDKALQEYLSTGKKVTDGELARSLDANYKQRGRAWEREAAITMMELTPDGAEAVLAQNCGVRIQGNYSRSDLQKSFRLYARSDYGAKKFRYAVFGDDYRNDAGEVMDRFDTLVLRAGGNCAFTAKFNDAFWQSFLYDSACETQRSHPCVVYLNGEYWGLYVLQEDYTNDYFEDLHGVEKDDIVVYKGDAETYEIGYKLDEGDLPDGESVDYYFRDLLDFFACHDDLKDAADYDEFCTLVDPRSVMDYFAVQCWVNNKWDWPGKNWSMWKTTRIDDTNPYADGRWRLQFYDMDFGGVSGKSDAYTNTIKEDNYRPDGLLDKNTSNPMVLCFAYLMSNDGFRSAFCERLDGLSDDIFADALGRLDLFCATYSPLYDQFYARYPGSGSSWNALHGGYASALCLRAFLNERADHIGQMIVFCGQIYPT